jgi:saccharopepsin
MFSRTPLLIVLLPLTLAKIHKLKLKKLPPAIENRQLESLYLTEKYAERQQQTPIQLATSARGNRSQGQKNIEQLFWTEGEANGGHRVPLSSLSPYSSIVASLTSNLGYMNAEYYSEITLGTPPQTVRISLMT